MSIHLEFIMHIACRIVFLEHFKVSFLKLVGNSLEMRYILIYLHYYFLALFLGYFINQSVFSKGFRERNHLSSTYSLRICL